MKQAKKFAQDRLEPQQEGLEMDEDQEEAILEDKLNRATSEKDYNDIMDKFSETKHNINENQMKEAKPLGMINVFDYEAKEVVKDVTVPELLKMFKNEALMGSSHVPD